MEESDAGLVARVRAGDGRAADRLLERYFRACRAVALAVTGNEADADDACQDGFVASEGDFSANFFGRVALPAPQEFLNLVFDLRSRVAAVPVRCQQFVVICFLVTNVRGDRKEYGGFT